MTDHADKMWSEAAAVGMQMIGASRIGDLGLTTKIGVSLNGREAMTVSVWLAIAAGHLLRLLDESDGVDVDTLLAEWGKLVARLGLEAEEGQ